MTATESSPRSADAPAPLSPPAGPGASPAGRWLIAAATVLVALALVVHVAPWVTKGFGVSYEGYNGAMWGIGARGAVEEPIGNRLGGIQATGRPYVHHPPLLMWTTAVAAGVTGERPVALRAAPLLASLAALALLILLLRDAGCSSPAIAGGVVVAGTTGMFLTYGAMIDTPVFSLPFGLAALAAAQRAWQGRAPATGLLMACGALATLSGWQAALVAGLAAGACLLSPDRASRRAGHALAGGVVLGTAATAAWVLWTVGSFREMADQAVLRTGGDVGWSAWIDRQDRFLGDLFGWPVVALTAIGLGLALWGRRSAADERTGSRAGDGPDLDSPPRGGAGSWGGLRPVAAVLIVGVAGYSVALRQASAVHDYWTFWGVALVAVAVAATVGGLERVAARTSSRTAAVALHGLAVVVVAGLVVGGVARRSDADAALREGLDAVPVLEAAVRIAREGDGAGPLVVRNSSESRAPWADWATDRRPELPTTAELAQLDGDRLLFIQTAGPPTPEVEVAALAVEGRYAILRVDDYRAVIGG
ncbi:MAG: glycosyltransferase family 39 protein [Iamia sp.]